MTSEAVRGGTRSWPAYYTVVGLCFAAVLISYLDRTNISVASISMQEQFRWSETTKGLVLSSFFIGYLVLQVPAGTLSNRYGGKMVLGLAVAWWSLFTVLTPLAARVSLPVLIGARIALGLGEAAVFPASINMVGRWVPVAEQSRAVALFTSGLLLGTVLALPVTGVLVRSWGWGMPFYAFGALGLVWAVAWFARVGGGYGVAQAPTTQRTIPWRRILSSPAVWAIIVSHFCNNWALYVLLAWLPSFFKETFGVTVASAGFLSAAPWAIAFIAANAAGVWADRMIASGRSTTFVRKALQLTAFLGAAIFFLLLRQAGSVSAGLLLMCGATGCLSLSLAGFAPNSLDIAPRYADVIWGISNTFATIPGIVGVAVTGWLVDRTGGYAAPFLVTAALGVVGAVVFLLFGSGRREIE